MNNNSINNEENFNAASGINAASGLINGLILSLIIWVLAILFIGCSNGSNNAYNVPNGVDAKINKSPIADAGADQTIAVTEFALLNGSGSYDPDGNYPLTYEWQIVSMPEGSLANISETASIIGSDASKFSIKADLQGDYIIQLVVTDSLSLSSDPTFVTVSTSNSAPVADAGSDQTAYRNDQVTLDGSGSSDVDGDSLTYAWSLITVPDGSSASLSDPAAVHPTFAVDASGTYVAQLIVNDGTLDSAPDTVTIDSLNSRPVADAGSDQTFSNAVVTIQLNGNQSYDPDCDPLSYEWNIVSRPPESSAALSNNASISPTFEADFLGTYIIQLIVTDDIGLSSDPDQVIITSGNVRPVAKAGFNQVVLVGEDVHLDGSGSYDANNDPLAYGWNMISKPKGSSTDLSNYTTVNPNFFADTQGEFVIGLVVNDGSLDSNSSSVTILAIDVGNLDDFIRALIEAVRAINNLDPSDFNNENNRNALTSKIITSVLSNYIKGSFDQNMLDKLRDDIAGKTDGCTSIDFPDVDQNDWIMNCHAQGDVYPHLIQAITILEASLNIQ